MVVCDLVDEYEGIDELLASSLARAHAVVMNCQNGPIVDDGATILPAKTLLGNISLVILLPVNILLGKVWLERISNWRTVQLVIDRRVKSRASSYPL